MNTNNTIFPKLTRN